MFFNISRRHSIRPLCLAISTSALLIGSVAVAQAPVAEVIVVTPVPGQSIERQRIAANIQTVTAEEIARSHAADLASFMNRRLGSVHVNDVQNNPFQPDVNFRGFTDRKSVV